MTEKEGGGIDAGRVMQEIRARVAERKETGQYTDAEIAEIASMELRLREAETWGGETDRLVTWLHGHWEATGPVDTEGAPAAGPLREWVKRLLRRGLSPLARLLLGKQNQINAKLVQLLSGSIHPLREDARSLEKSVGDLARKLERENGDLQAQLRDLAARVERMESGTKGRGRGGE